LKILLSLLLLKCLDGVVGTCVIDSWLTLSGILVVIVSMIGVVAFSVIMVVVVVVVCLCLLYLSLS
jgi:hypothetical protein